MSARALVLAKAPVAGRVKTRLGAVIGHDLAAVLAAAALRDTLAACTEAFDECHLALDGDLASAVDGPALQEATAGWHVFAQCDGDLGARLAHAHATVAAIGSGPVVQVGMDTPQVAPAALRDVADRVAPGAAVLGRAADGGWWVLGLDGAGADVLRDVPMSVPDTADRTCAALAGFGLDVRAAAVLRDVDTVADAEAVARLAPGTRFARAWRQAVDAA